ncbi:MAG: hypothetical protein AMXMBFR33_47530 [Candidatus Xenobia bacterium]
MRIVPTSACSLMRSDPVQEARRRAERRFGRIEGVQIAVHASPASSGRPVVVLRNQRGATEGFQVHTHFHGDQLYDQQVGYEQRIGSTVERAWQSNPDQVFVLPEARNESAAPRSDWNNIRNLGDLADGAVQASGLDPARAGRTVVSGHSAGGSVIAKAIARQDRLPDRIELYDAAVGSTHNPVSPGERRALQAWCRDNPERFVVVPGVMQSSWLEYVDRSRWTERASDHWSPLWDSLGQAREPGGGLC